MQHNIIILTKQQTGDVIFFITDNELMIITTKLTLIVPFMHSKQRGMAIHLSQSSMKLLLTAGDWTAGEIR